MIDLLAELKTKENTMIGLQRLRDFYNPTLSENADKVDDFMKFVLCLLQVFFPPKDSAESISAEQSEAILLHLKEMASIEVVG